MTVHELRKQGNKVRVIHVREKTYHLIKTELEESYEFFYSLRYAGINAKGGRTIIEISSPDGKEAFGIAHCHPQDNYNKKEGVRQALKRALENLNHV